MRREENMKPPGEFPIPVQGWEQFLANRKELLDKYDSASAKSCRRRVKTSHGNVGEAAIRKWLSGFLPAKYGVTSGYVISQGMEDTETIPHCDVIIYDKLEAPVLWIDSSADVSEIGSQRAIPAEHVKCILEVKSSFDSITARDAVSHITQLKPFMQGEDHSDELYKRYLPASFVWGLVFFELREKSAFSKNALTSLLKGIDFRGFFGGVILRRKESKSSQSGLIELVCSATPVSSNIGHGKLKHSLFDGLARSDSRPISGNKHISSVLLWLEPFFARFAFDLIARLNGTYRAGYLSSFHGFGGAKFESF